MIDIRRIILAFTLGVVGGEICAADNELVPPAQKAGKTVITGENFYFNPTKNIAVYEGDVVVIDPEMDLLCDKLTIFFAEKEKGAPENIVKTPAPADGVKQVKDKKAKDRDVAPMVGLGGNIDKIIAEGDVEILNKKEKTRAVGGHAEYLAKTELLVLTVNPKLFTKQGVLLGKTIEYNRRTGELSAKQAILENSNKPNPPSEKSPRK